MGSAVILQHIYVIGFEVYFFYKYSFPILSHYDLKEKTFYSKNLSRTSFLKDFYLGVFIVFWLNRSNSCHWNTIDQWVCLISTFLRVGLVSLVEKT